ncbi:MAG: efflux RND transporter permease subunit [Planctomycetota bacterium]
MLPARDAALRFSLFAAALLITAVAFPLSRQLAFDQTIESFFPPQHPDILQLQQTRQDFGGDEFVIVAWQQPDLLQKNSDGDYDELTPAASATIQQLSDRLSALPGVDGPRTRDLCKLLNSSLRNRNSRAAMLRIFQGLLIGPDQQTTAIILQLLPPEHSGITRAAAIRGIRQTAIKSGLNPFVAGEPVQVQEMFDLVERDGHTLYLASLGVLALMLLLIFRSPRWVVAPLLIVVGSVLCTRAALVLVGARLSMVSSMLNSMVTIIAIGTSTHIIVHYRELRTTQRLTPAAACQQTLRELWHPVFWTVVTIAVGFAALLVSQIVPVRSFAIMMTLGTLMTLLLTVLVMPAALAGGQTIPIPGRVALEDHLDQTLGRIAQFIVHHPRRATLACCLLLAVTTPGLLLMQVETDFSRNFRDSSPVLKALRFVESTLGPAGTWDVSFDVPAPLTPLFLDRIDELTKKLRQLADSGLPLEVVSLTDALNVPPRLGTAVKRLELIRRRQPDLVNSFHNTRNRRMRIVLRSPEQQTTDLKLDQIRQVRTVVASHFRELEKELRTVSLDNGQPQTEGTPWQARESATGLFVLMARIIDSLLADQFRSFLWASLGTMLCTAAAFRSLKIGLISLVPNVFPIAVVTGLLGLLQVPVNIGTAMIASVSMGFTCSVHYIAVFRSALPEVGLAAALERAQAGVGKAVVLAHIALVAGFLVLTASEFIPLVYFGALLSLSMIGGLVSDLVMLPLLLRWTTPDPPPAAPPQTPPLAAPAHP